MGTASRNDPIRRASLRAWCSRMFALLGAAALVFVCVVEPAYAISRDTIIARAQRWVDLKVPYSQTTTFEGYRTDCSGFVSMAWALPVPGRSTRNLAEVCTPITKDDLQPGDMMLLEGSHAAIFAGWANPERTVWRSLEQSSSNSGAVARLIPYPWWGGTAYLPYRYKGVGDDYLDAIVPVYGQTRYETAVKAAWLGHATAGSTQVVVVATGADWPDALGGAALAGAYDAPVLLTRGKTLPTEVRDEIARLGAERAIVLGGPSAVETAVVDAIAALPGVAVERIGGKDRYETAALVARATAAGLAAGGRTYDGGAYLATGRDFPDALAASPPAYVSGRPILLTRRSQVPSSTLEVFADLAVEDVWVLGGEAAVDTTAAAQVEATGATVRRLSGANRYATALVVATHGEALGLKWAGAGMATGTSFADALSGGVAQGKAGSLMLLTPPNSMRIDVESALRAKRSQIGKVRCYGGYAAIGDAVRARIAHAIRGE